MNDELRDPSHCTGREAMAILAATFGRRFIGSGAGRIITVNDLNNSVRG